MCSLGLKRLGLTRARRPAAPAAAVVASLCSQAQARRRGAPSASACTARSAWGRGTSAAQEGHSDCPWVCAACGCAQISCMMRPRCPSESSSRLRIAANLVAGDGAGVMHTRIGRFAGRAMPLSTTVRLLRIGLRVVSAMKRSKTDLLSTDNDGSSLQQTNCWTVVLIIYAGQDLTRVISAKPVRPL